MTMKQDAFKAVIPVVQPDQRVGTIRGRRMTFGRMQKPKNYRPPSKKQQRALDAYLKAVLKSEGRRPDTGLYALMRQSQ